MEEKKEKSRTKILLNTNLLHFSWSEQSVTQSDQSKFGTVKLRLEMIFDFKGEFFILCLIKKFVWAKTAKIF